MTGNTVNETAIGKKAQNAVNPVKIKAVIFDLDATIVDSEPNYYEADRKLLAEYGIADFTMEMKKKYIGGSSMDQMIGFKKTYGIEDSPEILLKKKNRYYLELAKKNTLVFPEMRKLLIILKNRELKLALASGSSKTAINAVIASTNLQEYFDVILSSEEVEKGKPNPDIFLEASRLLSISPEFCLVVEDSVHGVEAAKSAGMFCIAVPYLKEMSGHESYAKADLLFPDGMPGFTASKSLDWMKSV